MTGVHAVLKNLLTLQRFINDCLQGLPKHCAIMPISSGGRREKPVVAASCGLDRVVNDREDGSSSCIGSDMAVGSQTEKGELPFPDVDSPSRSALSSVERLGNAGFRSSKSVPQLQWASGQRGVDHRSLIKHRKVT